jgi:2-phosphosulfolactate phosphatase
VTTIDVLFTPADFLALKNRDLSGTVCVIFDVLRATSTMVTALANGAAGVTPVEGIPEALTIRKSAPEVLLTGERDGVRIPAGMASGIAFDLGNSPREFTPEVVRGRRIAMTTTNGTRALRACAQARVVLVSCFLNLGATAEFLGMSRPQDLLLVCSGTFEEAAYEDVLGAGALCDLVWDCYGQGSVADSAQMARRLFLLERQDLPGAFSRSRNGRRLLAKPELREDVSYCAQTDKFHLVAEMDKEGVVRVRKQGWAGGLE